MIVKSGLEWCFTRSYEYSAIVVKFYCSLLRGHLVLISTVTIFIISVILIRGIFVMFCNYWFHIRHAAVTQFNCILVKYLSSMLLKMVFY